LATGFGMVIAIVRSATDQENRIAEANRAISAGVEGDASVGLPGGARPSSPMSGLFASRGDAPIVAGAVPEQVRPTPFPLFGLFNASQPVAPAGSAPLPASAPVSAPSGPIPPRTATPLRTAVPGGAPIAEPTAPPEPTEFLPAASALVISGTQGGGVLRSGPSSLEAILRIWPEGARMVAIGPRVEADGILWLNVRAPDGGVGWIAAGTVAAAPAGSNVQPAPVVDPVVNTEPTVRPTSGVLATALRSTATARPTFTLTPEPVDTTEATASGEGSATTSARSTRVPTATAVIPLTHTPTNTPRPTLTNTLTVTLVPTNTLTPTYTLPPTTVRLAPPSP
jgi:hypothetical protein